MHSALSNTVLLHGGEGGGGGRTLRASSLKYRYVAQDCSQARLLACLEQVNVIRSKRFTIGRAVDFISIL